MRLNTYSHYWTENLTKNDKVDKDLDHKEQEGCDLTNWKTVVLA